jgi:hypothetical protein
MVDGVRRARRRFTCDRCQGNFPSNASKAETLAEAQALLPGDPFKSPASLCDDYYAVFLVWFNALPPEKKATLAAESIAAQSG